MSKHLVEINFNELKFNLYELLGVPSNSPEKKIKKAYRKLILKVHPDKNNYEDEEIFNHLTMANQILTNTLLREKYDNWLKSFGQDSLSHSDLKHGYKNSIDKLNLQIPNIKESKESYQDKIQSAANDHINLINAYESQINLKIEDMRKKYEI